MKELYDYHFYSKNFQKIRTKLDGLQPFRLREYQTRFIDFWDNIKGPKRIIVLKPRQSGFSTLAAGKISHNVCTQADYKAFALADKKGRTMEIAGMYRTFITELRPELRPMIALNNTEQIWLDNPDESARKTKPGLRSGVRFETGNDPNAGRSGTRKAAHISEAAFIRYMNEIDEGTQNSIPLDPETVIIKESTANGRAGIGKPYFDLWQAAKRGDSIYKNFFVAWYEIDDYRLQLEKGFHPTKYERELMKRFPQITKQNLMWRRLKILEYLHDDENQIFTPEERFKQDFPVDDEEAFLSSGAPVFPVEKVNKLTNALTTTIQKDIKEKLNIESYLIKNHWEGLEIYTPPRLNSRYYIGADISEGLAQGDASSAFIMDHNYNQVGRWHGKIDPDLFGDLLIDLAKMYNDALIIPEKNNMGLTTVLTIKNSGYPKLYKEMVEDKVTKQITERLGWVTTSKSKMTMLNSFITMFRDEELGIKDIRLAQEMGNIAREENGNVILNGKDRVVACGLAIMGRKSENITVYTPKERINKELYDPNQGNTMPKKESSFDIFG